MDKCDKHDFSKGSTIEQIEPGIFRFRFKEELTERQGRTSDKAFLLWVAARFVNIHKESPNVDFVRRIVAIAESLPPDQSSRWS